MVPDMLTKGLSNTTNFEDLRKMASVTTIPIHFTVLDYLLIPGSAYGKQCNVWGLMICVNFDNLGNTVYRITSACLQ